MDFSVAFLLRSAILHDELIAFAVYVYNLDRRVVFEVLAQLRDVDVHAACIKVVVIDPDGLESHVALEDAVGVGAEEFEELALLGGEFYDAVAVDELLLLGIELEVPSL